MSFSGITMRMHWALAAALLSLSLGLAGCGGSASDSDDTDGDGITNGDEGMSAGTNTDGDAWPDWLDLDSDGDGILDADEAGDTDLSTPPVDTDMDGTPDFQDLDSDGDGIIDGFCVDPITGMPCDTDMDGVPDFRDLDDDGDTIADTAEAPGGVDRDFDMDGIPNRLDLDSDGDGVPDAIEAGDDLLATAPVDTDGDGAVDYLDLDSDGDGLADALEDLNGNGIVDSCGMPAIPPCESDRLLADTDGDGFLDLVESVAGTNPNDPMSTIPSTDFYFVLPCNTATGALPCTAPPQTGILSFSTTVNRADIFFSVDTTASFGEEIANIQSTIDTVIVPGVTGVITSPAFGVGRFEDFPIDPFGVTADVPFELLQPMTTAVGPLSSAVMALSPALGGNDVPEAGMEGLYQWASGAGIPEMGIAPFAPGDIGGAGFRIDSLPIIVQIADAKSHLPMDYAAAGITTHGRDDTVAALNAIGARVIGIRSIGNDGNANDPLAELVDLAIATRAVIPVDPMDGQCHTGIGGAPRAPVMGACPVVFDVAVDGTGLAGIIVDAIAQLAALGVLDVSTRKVGRTTAVQPAGHMIPTGTSADFITSIVPVAPAPAGSTIMGNVFLNVTPGSTVQFELTAQNTFVPEIPVVQLYTLDIEILGDGVTVLDVRTVYVIVPARIDMPVIM